MLGWSMALRIAISASRFSSSLDVILDRWTTLMATSSREVCGPAQKNQPRCMQSETGWDG
jgi:hypothetical protein